MNIDMRKTNLINIVKVQDLLVLKGIAPDIDTAKKIIHKYVQKKEETISFDDFYRIFCKCIFKESLISMYENVNESTTKI